MIGIQPVNLDTQGAGKLSPVAIQLSNVSAGYGRRMAIHDVNAAVEVGKRVAIIGPNGAGKSTLFKSIVGLITPSSGHISICGQPAQQARQAVAYVPQFEDVDWDFPVSVTDVVVMGLARQIGWLRLPNAHHVQVARQSLERVNLAQYANRQIGELSGGQKRRVFIARALAQGASILLLDEPFSGVDAVSQQALFDVLDTLRTDGVTVILATHDLSIVSTHFDELLILNKKVVAYGKPADVFKPALLSEAFGGQMAMWNADGQVIIVTDQHS